MGYVIFRGVGTEGAQSVVGSGNVLTDVYVSKMPDHKKASMRFTEYYVKGRDGALHVDEGFADFDLEVHLVLIKAAVSKRQLVNAWADGTGKLVTSDDITKAYRATVKEEIEWTRVMANGGYYDSAKIVFKCEPCMYEASETVQQFTQSGSILNPGSADAYPLIAIEGSGTSTVTIAGNTIEIESMTAGVPVYLDCETGYVYSNTGATEMRGELPVLPVGQSSSIVFGTGVTKVTITPHWRWV